MSIGRHWSRAALALAVALAASGLLPRAAHGQGTALVLPSDLAYRDLDRLAALGALDSAIMGHRPWSRREIARLARAAEQALLPRATEAGDGRSAAAAALATARALSSRFAADERPGNGGAPVVALLDGAALTYVGSSMPRRALVGLGRDVEATIGAFGDRRLGAPEEHGHGAALELAQRIEPTGWLAATARGRLELRAQRDPAVDAHAAELLVASVRARARNVAVTVGRSPVAWSQHEDTGLLFASDAPALDHVSLAGDRPFRLPGVLRRAGSVQATLLLADLGPSRVRSHSRLLAYKVTAAPARHVEIGGSFANRFGGAGSRPASATDRLIDFLPFIDIFRRHNYTDTTRALEVESDKTLGLDGRLRLGGVVLSGELLVDDFDVHRLRTLVTWDGSQSLRITVPRLAGESYSLHLSAVHTGIRAYSHHQLTAGHAVRGRLLGDELGPDAKAFGARLEWAPGPHLSAGVEARTALHSKAEYEGISDGTYFAIRRTGPASNEQRDRLVWSVLARPRAGRAVVARAGVVRSRNHAFTGATRYDGRAEVSILVTR